MHQFGQLFIKYLVIHLIFVVLGCSRTNNIDDIKAIKTITNDKVISNASVLNISSQLTECLGVDDYFFFNQDLNIANAIKFSTVHDFTIFKNEHSLYSNDIEIIELNGYYKSRFRDVYNFIMVIEIDVIQKLEDEDSNINYIIKNIESRIKGDSFGREWDQLTFDYSIFSGTAIIDFKGYLKYQLIISNHGIVFNDAKHYKLIIDIHTGIPISFEEF